MQTVLVQLLYNWLFGHWQCLVCSFLLRLRLVRLLHGRVKDVRRRPILILTRIGVGEALGTVSRIAIVLWLLCWLLDRDAELVSAMLHWLTCVR